MFCSKCGSKLQEGTSFCTSCGTQVNQSSGAPIQQQQYQAPPQQQVYQQPIQQNYQQPMQYNQQPLDDGKIGLAGIFCFLLPIIGIVLYFSWKNTKPLKAGKAMKFALAGIILGFAIRAAVG
jgi:uncharacterized membrane protein YvbJ